MQMPMASSRLLASLRGRVLFASLWQFALFTRVPRGGGVLTHSALFLLKALKSRNICLLRNFTHFEVLIYGTVIGIFQRRREIFCYFLNLVNGLNLNQFV